MCREILELKKQMQDSKQCLVAQREEGLGEEGIEGLRPTDVRRGEGRGVVCVLCVELV